MKPVIVWPPSSGSVTILAWLPAAMATIIVSPTARLRPRTIEAAMPEMAAGKTTRSTVRIRFAPGRRTPHAGTSGTADMASSASEATVGMIMTPRRARRRARENVRPRYRATVEHDGPTNVTANRP